MSKEIKWNKLIVETFIEEAMLNKDEEWILRTRVAGWTVSQQADYMGVSNSTVNRYIKTLKEKYDNVSKYNPLLPPRKPSKEEEYMDNN